MQIAHKLQLFGLSQIHLGLDLNAFSCLGLSLKADRYSVHFAYNSPLPYSLHGPARGADLPLLVLSLQQNYKLICSYSWIL